MGGGWFNKESSIGPVGDLMDGEGGQVGGGWYLSIAEWHQVAPGLSNGATVSVSAVAGMWSPFLFLFFVLFSQLFFYFNLIIIIQV